MRGAPRLCRTGATRRPREDPTNSIETARTLLRRLDPGDAAALFRTTGDPGVMRFWAPGPDADVSATAERIAQIETHWDAHGFGDWAVVDASDDELIGFCGLHFIDDVSEVNIGYALARDRWRGGLGYEICRAVLTDGFSRLELPQVVAVIDPVNAASIRLAEKCGLTWQRRLRWAGRERVAYGMSREEWMRQMDT